MARPSSEHPRLVAAVAVAVMLAAIGSLAGGAWFLSSLRTGLPDKDAIGRMGDMSEATLVYDATDKLAFTIYAEQRIDVPLAEISPNLIRAILAIEDQRFYKHHGFDLIRIASAALVNVRRGRAAQGGSTITQQLARQSFLTPDKTIRRKLQELILAERIEWAYQKPQILELYLNKVYFGDGLYGVETAARGYFGKHASELVAAGGRAARRAGEVAVGVRADDKSRTRDRTQKRRASGDARQRRHRSRHVGAGARTAHVVLRDGLRTGDSRGQYFKEQVRQELVDRFGWERVYQGGLRVFSTIDMAMQESAEASVAQSLKALDEKRQALASRAPSRRGRERRRTAAGGADCHGSSNGPGARDGGRPRFRGEPFQPRRAGAPPAGLGVQAVRLRRRAGGRLYAGDRDRSLERSDRDPARAPGRRKTNTRPPNP